VGTHAVLEDKVKFKNLGLAIIDEQHGLVWLNEQNFGLKIKFRLIFWS
jgi:transcription-repair coupling factor (superfamily II helicase)